MHFFTLLCLLSLSNLLVLAPRLTTSNMDMCMRAPSVQNIVTVLAGNPLASVPDHTRYLYSKALLLSAAKSARECHPPRLLLNSTYNEHFSCQRYLWQAGAAVDRSACCCANAYVQLLLWLLIAAY